MASLVSDITGEIRAANVWLTQKGFADSQNFPRVCKAHGCDWIGFGADNEIGLLLRSREDYAHAFSEVVKANAFTFRLLDGAICQFNYCISKDRLVKHRLGYFNNPYLDQFQNALDGYDDDSALNEIISANNTAFPIRFDYDVENVSRDDHPISHLTLGQFKGCRIPVSAPITPLQFIRFLLKNFYSSMWLKVGKDFPRGGLYFDDCIIEPDKVETHIRLGRPL